jgi:hypothetical protein
MITRAIYVPQHSWTFRVYIPLSCYWTGEIIRHLWRLGASDKILYEAAENMQCGKLNNGLTYASGKDRETLVVVGKTTTAAELFNSVVHEIDHAAMFTFPLLEITPGTEEAAYFKGGLAREIFPMVQPYLCDCCRSKMGHKKGPNSGV